MSWDGSAGSGFTVPPSDPVRTTAKPAMRLMVPPNQRFTDTLTIGVLAGANDGGTLFSSLGLAQVQAYFEDDVPTECWFGFHSFADANGNPVTYLGWWITLQKPSGQTGESQVYFEAVPRDSTMQNRVIGPYSFFPMDTLYDLSLTVNSAGGANHTTLKSAMVAAKNAGVDHALITITGGSNYSFDWTGRFDPAGYIVIQSDVPVTIDPPAVWITNFGNGDFVSHRCGTDGVWLKGSNITLDFRYANEFYHESGGNQHVFDGINITRSTGRYTLWRQRPVNVLGWLFRNRPYFLECNVSYTDNTCDKASLIRGGTFTDLWADFANEAYCVVGTTLNSLDGVEYITEIPALTIAYMGAAATATVALTGGNGATSKVMTLKEDGVTAASYTILNTEAAYLAGDQYTVQHVADFINGQADWTATVLDNTRFAASLGLTGTKGVAVADTDAKTAPLTLVTMFDVHGDWYQKEGGSLTENVILYGNVGTDLVCQNLFFNDSTGINDLIAINNAFHNRTDIASSTGLRSQTANPHSHVVIAHNSMASQDMLLRTPSYDPDGYCLIANNALVDLTWESTPDADLVIAGNHLQVGSTAPSGSTGTTIGGDMASLFVDAANGDFTPAGELADAANLKASVVPFDRSEIDRDQLTKAGAQD